MGSTAVPAGGREERGTSWEGRVTSGCLIAINSLRKETETTVVAMCPSRSFTIFRKENLIHTAVSIACTSAWDGKKSKTAQCVPVSSSRPFTHPSSAQTSSVSLSSAAWTAQGIGLAASEVGWRPVASKSTPSLMSGLPNSFSSSSSISMSRFVLPPLRSIGFGRENIDCPDLCAGVQQPVRMTKDCRSKVGTLTVASQTPAG